MMGKDKIVFDPANAAETDNIGAYVRAEDGTLITHTTDGAKERLDVATGIEKNSGDAYTLGDRGAAVWAVDPAGDYAPLRVNADGELLVDVQVTTGADKAEDSAHASGDVGSYVLSVREDTLTTSTSASGDYQSFKTDSLGALWTRVTEIPQPSGFTATTFNNVPVGLTATPVPASALANRKKIQIQNIANKEIFIGFDNTVTTSTGLRLSPGSFYEIELGAGVSVYAISTAAAQNLRYAEFA